MPERLCARATCSEPAVATLTYDYLDMMAVLGPLAEHREPQSHDLCQKHADRITMPVGWQLIRHTSPTPGR